MKIAAASTSTYARRSRLASTGRVWTTLVVALFLGFANASFGQAPQPSTGGAPPQGQTQGSGQSPTETANVAAPQIAQFFQVSGNREIQGEPLTLERLLYGVYSPAERNRRLAAYWDLAGRNAQYNLCVVCGGYVNECANKVAQLANSSDEARTLIASARQIALGRQSAARLKFLQGQYDFDAAFTTAAGRRAAVARAAESGVRSVDATSGVVFYIPSAKPATDVYQTRYAELVPYLGRSPEAARLNTLIPLLYETLQARATQAARELDVLVSLANAAQPAPTALFAAIDRYRDAASQTIDAAVRYNQAIAAYSSLATPANIQGAAFLATINQRPAPAQSQQRQPQNAAPNRDGAQSGANGATGADVGAPRRTAPQRFAYYLPGYLPEGVKETPVESSPTRPAEPQTVAAAASDAAPIEVASLASIQPLAPVALPLADAAPISARNLDSEATFTPVAYSRPRLETPPAALVAAPAAPEPAPTAPPETKAEPASNPEPEKAPESAPAPIPEQSAPSEPSPEAAPEPAPTPDQNASSEPTPNPAPESNPEQSAPKPDESVMNEQELPIIIVITGYEQPFKPDEESTPGESEQTTASGQSTPPAPDGAWLDPLRAATRGTLLATLRAFFLKPKTETCDETLDGEELVVRGQDITLPDDDFGAAPAPQPGAVASGAPQVDAGTGAPTDAASRQADVARVRALTTALFAIETPPAPTTGGGADEAYERLYTLHEIASRANQSPAGRNAVAVAFWKLQGACARLRVEETIFRNFTLVYNNLDEGTRTNSEVGRACLAAALEQQARLTEAKTLKRAAQTELLGFMGLSSASAALPVPATLPFCDAAFNPSLSGYADLRSFRNAELVRARIKSVQEYGATLDSPGQLLNVNADAVSASNVELLVASLQKKRESALLFVDHVVALNFAIANYVAFFPARFSSDQFVDALAGRR